MGRTILIIDDDEDISSSVRTVLESAGHTVLRAANGKEGIELARSERPALILLDFMMPIMDGFHVCSAIDQEQALRDIPIIAFTAFGQDIMEVGLSPYAPCRTSIRECIEKPVEPNVLLHRVESLIGR